MDREWAMFGLIYGTLLLLAGACNIKILLAFFSLGNVFHGWGHKKFFRWVCIILGIIFIVVDAYYLVLTAM